VTGWRHDLLGGHVALVTGGSRGIGKAIARAYAAAGAQVMISSRKADALSAAVAEIPGDLAWTAANAGDPDDAARCVDATIERFGRLDILVNNAATNPYYGPLVDIDRPRAEKTVQVNQVAALTWTQRAWHAWMADHGGCVVNIASVGGFALEPNIGMYNVTKAALIYLTRQLAGELAPTVRVNAIAPGLIRTDMARALLDVAEASAMSRIPLGRIGQPHEIADAAVYLASPLASYVTGHVLVADGGALVAGARASGIERAKETAAAGRDEGKERQ
jgi:NAD(P)-dependent dehydrogenase (short-subunit alcohol dehydrogenase family)